MGKVASWVLGSGCALGLIASRLSPVYAQFAVNQVSEFNNGSDVDQYSQTADAVLTYTPGPAITYENVVANGNWIVQNLPMLSTAQASGPQSETTQFDLSQIGGSNGTLDNATVSDFSTVSATPLTAAPATGAPGSFTVGNTEEQVDSGVPSGVLTPNSPGLSPINWGILTAAQILGVQNAFITGLPNVVQGKNFCGPGAAANALGQSGVLTKTGRTTTQAMNAMAPLMGNANDGNWDNDEMSGLFQYTKSLNVPLAISYENGTGNKGPKSPSVGNYTDPVTGMVATNAGALSANWLLGDLANNQSVQFETDTHWVSLCAEITFGPITLLEYRDDPFQAGTATTNAQAATIASRYVWTYLTSDGYTNIGNGKEAADSAVSETVVPEPTGGALLMVLLAGGIVTRRRSSRLA